MSFILSIRKNWRRTMLTLTALATIGNITIASPVEAAVLARCKTVPLIAHRGLSDAKHTENTLRAFRHAARKGVVTVEADIRLTRDGQWVFMHDERVTRTTNGTGLVATQTLAELKTYKTDDGELGGIPTLAQGYRFLKNNPGMKMQLEFKAYGEDATPIKEALALADSMGVKSRITFISFYKKPLNQVERIDSSATIGLLTTKQVSVETAAKYDKNILISQAAVTPKYVDHMHKRSVNVYTWTVNTREQWRDVVTDGVDGITTDNAPALSSYCRNR